MLKLGTQTGSIVNHVASMAGGTEMPNVGDPATFLSWTDRSPGTVVDADPKSKIFRVNFDEVQFVKPGEYVFRPTDPSVDEGVPFKMTDKGPRAVKFNEATKRWNVIESYAIALGQKSYYRDPSF